MEETIWIVDNGIGTCYIILFSYKKKFNLKSIVGCRAWNVSGPFFSLTSLCVNFEFGEDTFVVVVVHLLISKKCQYIVDIFSPVSRTLKFCV